MEDLRRALAARGQDSATIDVLLQSWAPSTVFNYDGYWRRWRVYCQREGKNPLARDDSVLSAWIAQLILGSQAGEVTAEKARSVVSSTWDLIEDPAAVLAKLPKAAAKINKAKKRPSTEVWDLAYLFQYCYDKDAGIIARMTYKELLEHAVVLLKGASGWRSADLTCIYINYGLREEKGRQKGYSLRLFDTKTYKNAWTPWVFFPRLAPHYATICVATVIDFLRAQQQKFTHAADTSKEIANPQGQGKVKDVPLFCFKDKAGLRPMARGTIANYFKRTFLQNVTSGDIPLDKAYPTLSAHANRHAVASTLMDMRQPLSDIARLTLNSPATLQDKYCIGVDRHWAIPQECVNAQDNLSVKLLLPFIHFISKEHNENAQCDCALALA
jgi:hypothetical protein